MAVEGWIIDKSVTARMDQVLVEEQLAALDAVVHVCRVGQLEQLYSAQSGAGYNAMQKHLETHYPLAEEPEGLLSRALLLQRDLAHHHGLWHRIPIPDLLIAETALHHGFGVLHIDRDFERIAAVRPLTERRLA